jgi:tetratricopeptide (TPR) repeat protein
LGYGYYLNNEYEKALTEYRLVQQSENPPASSFYMEGQVYVRQGKYEEALRVFESKLAQIKGDDEYYFDAMMAIGNIYFYQIKNYPKAIETCVDLSLLYPENEDVLVSLMKAYNAFGKFDEANNVFKQLKTAFESKKILPHLRKTKSVEVADYFWGKKSIVIKRKFVEPEKVGDPYFIAVLYDAEGTLERVFLAEKTLKLTEKSPNYLLCENIKNGGHRNFGFGFKTEDINVKEMYEAVVLILEKNIAPAAEIRRE